jgi:glycosyltransferase involved in cell wall biosynthesis
VKNKEIHIVSFDVPFPADYGGVIDVFNRSKALKEAGFKVILHVFEYGRGRNHVFQEIADAIFYYKRSSFLKSFLQRKAYITSSRISTELIQRLNESSSDLIILEGQHCSGILPFLKRKAVVRIHNCEWEYYAALAEKETSFLKKIYFKREAKFLKKEEQVLKNSSLLCITKKEQEYYTKLGFIAIHVPTVFFLEVQNTSIATENYLLFHGNLSVSENVNAVQQLISENKKEKFDFKVCIAGKNPSKELKEKVEAAQFELIDSPDTTEMEKLIYGAKAHFLLTNQATGIKLKLIHALSSNRPVIVNEKMIQGTGLEDSCFVWDEKSPLSSFVNEVLQLPTKAVDLSDFRPEIYSSQIELLSK